jgi:DNA polymerase sigma
MAGISIRNGGAYFSKLRKPPVDLSNSSSNQQPMLSSSKNRSSKNSTSAWFNASQAFLLSIEDPQDPDFNDVARSSYAILQVRRAFEFAYYSLLNVQRAAKSTEIGSFLTSILPMERAWDMHQFREQLKLIYIQKVLPETSTTTPQQRCAVTSNTSDESDNQDSDTSQDSD